MDWDGADLNGTECASNGWTGTLACSPLCTFDWGSCNIPPEAYCGNWVIEGSEQCDGPNVGGTTCGALGFGFGSVGCSPACAFDTSACVPLGVGDSGPGDPASCGNPSGGTLAWTNGTGIPGEVYCFQYGDSAQVLAEKACESH